MRVEVTFDTGGAAPSGIDRGALVSNIQAELDKVAAKSGVSPPKPAPKAAPRGALGDLSAIQWLLEIATDPAMAKAYAQGLIFAINEIVRAAKAKKGKPKTGAASKKGEREEPILVRVVILGKAISLPAAASAIRSFLEKLGTDE